MGHLKEIVDNSDAELKRTGGARDALAKRQEGLRGELHELIAQLRKA